MRLRVRPRIVLLAFAALAVVASAAALAPPLLQRGFPAGHDAAAHLTYVYLFDEALGQGQLPVRWVEWVVPGHGQPLFSFYQPGFYYAVELVHAVVPSLLLSTKLTVLAAWWSGSLFVYLLLKPLGRWPALLGALLFMRTPYLILDVFVRAAFPEFLALACAPAVLWAIDRTLRSRRPVFALALAVFTAVMLVSHLPTVLMFLPVFTMYAVGVWLSGDRRWQSLTTPVAAAALGGGLACFYVIPALVELPFTKIRELTSAYFDYRRHFVEPWQWFSLAWGFGGSKAGAADAMSFQLGVLQWLTLAAGLIALVVLLRRAERRRAVWLLSWLIVAAAALLMTTAAATPIWRAVPPLAFVQFPWRFLTVASLSAAVVGALALASVRSRTLQAAVVLCVAAGLWWQTADLLRPVRYFPRGWMFIDDPGWRYDAHAADRAFIEPGYHPAGAVRLPARDVQRWRISRGQGDVSPRLVHDDRLVLQVEKAEGAELTLASRCFPVWKVLVDGTRASWSCDPEFGFIVIHVPNGTHTVEAALGNTPVRSWSNRVTVLSATIWSAWALALSATQARALHERLRARSPATS
jgi:hypothetical protein